MVKKNKFIKEKAYWINFFFRMESIWVVPPVVLGNKSVDIWKLSNDFLLDSNVGQFTEYVCLKRV